MDGTLRSSSGGHCIPVRRSSQTPSPRCSSKCFRVQRRQPRCLHAGGVPVCSNSERNCFLPRNLEETSGTRFSRRARIPGGMQLAVRAGSPGSGAAPLSSFPSFSRRSLECDASVRPFVETCAGMAWPVPQLSIPGDGPLFFLSRGPFRSPAVLARCACSGPGIPQHGLQLFLRS